ncbi:MAG: DinB family protein [Actinobacteria bacterium]|nr:DinB family protein [Actinomycetota bacterium]
MPTPEITDALKTTDEALGRLDDTLADLSDGDLHLAHRDGGWTAAELVSHINMSVLLWTATIARVTHDPELSFVFREEIGHDVKGYPPPRIEVARKQLDAARRTLATCIPAIGQDVLGRTVEIPDLGTLTIEVWTPPVLGHAAGHAQQALDVLRDRGAIQ